MPQTYSTSPVQIADIPQVGRKGRRPEHRFQIRQQPWVIQPFMIAPVLPGDTMKNLLMQARVVSDPVKNPLIGWWMEFYFYYIPHRALAGSVQFQAMMLDPNATAGNTSNQDINLHRYNNSVDWIGQCLDTIVKEFYRDEGETVFSQTINTKPAAQLSVTSWLDSVMTQAAFDATMPPDVDVEGPDANTVISASEIDRAMRQWEFLRSARLTDQTYEDFLRTYGVRIPDREQVVLPELIKYSREWTYPSNTVDPLTGTPTSALSWSISERADKDRFFREPGFIVGCSVARPKVYLRTDGSAVGMLDNVFGWLPAVLGNDPYASLKVQNAFAGPLANQNQNYIVDLKDLYLYGDQFINFALTETDAGIVAAPTGALQKKYPVDADVTNLFKTAAKNVRYDGVVHLNILARVVDTTAKV
jgi:hypothetical protein